MTDEDARGSHARRLLALLLQPLQAVLADPEVTEVLVNGPAAVWIERAGRLQATALSVLPVAVPMLARTLATLGAQVGFETAGVLETAWQDWRVTAVLPPVARDQALLCLRRHRPAALPLSVWQVPVGARPSPAAGGQRPDDASQRRRALVAAAAGGPGRLLEAVVRTRCNVLVAGGTGSGKTTLLASLIGAVDSAERVLTLEDTPELPLACAHQARLLAVRGHDLRGLLRLALRLRPDRLVVGEVRGGEAFDLVQAMATGHAGSMGTLHADHARGALARLEQLVLTAGLAWPPAAVREQVAACIQVLVQVQRSAAGRVVQEVQWLDGLDDGRYRLHALWTAHPAGRSQPARPPANQWGFS